jgi:protocatechuate 3,4-dioxygenase beta subunit
MKSGALVLTLLMLVVCGQTVPLPTQTAPLAVPTQTATFVPSPTLPLAASQTPSMTCTPTMDDGLSPSYQPDTPVRSVVGHGHVLTGVVHSSRDCAPIANAQLELWPEYAGQGHPDEARATIFTDSEGRYRFECDLPEHIHMKISAPGFRTLAQNSYHPNGAAEGTFDIVLEPESP